ncbi:MAG TPA: hypothetical protein VG123_10630 [Streptosporangiaceae bacterium]|jgi:hypothetical protein|nr:hypothetical protein [Streptosporangiaceae bacterium]
MHVNLGGDPGRDDFGLPPIDIEIPDDARELDRDVQAYHRELRALRWRRRTRRLHRPLTRDGMVLPLLAGCLALTLLAGTLLTVFTGEQFTLSTVGQPGHQLPDAAVMVDRKLLPLADLRGTVLALVPPSCGCAHLRQLAQEASRAGVEIYVVGMQGVQVSRLVRQVPLGPAHAVEDTGDALNLVYHPVTLTAVLVNLNGSVASVVPDRGRGFALAPEMRTLIPGNGGAAWGAAPR